MNVLYVHRHWPSTQARCSMSVSGKSFRQLDLACNRFDAVKRMSNKSEIHDEKMPPPREIPTTSSSSDLTKHANQPENENVVKFSITKAIIMGSNTSFVYPVEDEASKKVNKPKLKLTQDGPRTVLQIRCGNYRHCVADLCLFLTQLSFVYLCQARWTVASIC